MKASFPLFLAAGIALLSLSPRAGAQSAPAASVPQQSQATKEKKPRGEGPLAQLGLTEDQKKQVGPILKDTRSKAQAIRNDTSLAPKDKKQQLMALREATRGQLKSILTPDQLSKFEEMKAERKEHKKDGPATCPAAKTS